MALDNDILIYSEDLDQLNAALSRLLQGSQAKSALLVSRLDGSLMAQQGFTEGLDTTSLAALAAGAFASTREIAALIGEPEFSVLFHQGRKDHIHISLVDDASILMVLFDDRTTIGMVRLYAREVSARLARVFVESRSRPHPASVLPR